MLRCLACGFLLLSALLFLIPKVALACSLSFAPSWTKRTPDGAFELSSHVGDKPSGSATLSLRDVRSGKKLWEHMLELSEGVKGLVPTPRPLPTYKSSDTLGGTPWADTLGRGRGPGADTLGAHLQVV